MYRDGNTGNTDASTAAAINTAGQLASTAIGSMAQSSLNKKTRDWNEHMYGVQRKDALDDWNRQNDYNSPAAQMARLKAGNLNPNLVYGSGNATPSASSVRQSEVATWNPHAPDYSAIGGAVSNGISTYYDVRLKTAQLDNMKAQNNAIVQKAALDTATTAKFMADTAKTEFDTMMAKSLKDTSLSVAQEGLRKLQIGNEAELQSMDRQNALASSSLQEAATRILNNRLEGLKTQAQTDATRAQIRETEQRIQNLQTDNRVKQLDENMKKAGIQPSDNLFMRTLQKLLSETGISPGGSVLKGSQEFSRKVDSSVNNWLLPLNKQKRYR